jgi:hypothetical protein
MSPAWTRSLPLLPWPIAMRSLMMSPVISALLAFMAALFRSRASLYLEHLALRHQLAVYQRSVSRPHLHATDRLFWAWVSRLWSGWQNALVFVQPRTVIAWQRQGFRDHWRQLSQQGTPGRPKIAKELRDLIRTMWQANPILSSLAHTPGAGHGLSGSTAHPTTRGWRDQRSPRGRWVASPL